MPLLVSDKQTREIAPLFSKWSIVRYSEFPATTAALRFIRHSALRFAAASTAALVPLFWHRHLESGDLLSHTYNSSLAELIYRGQAPGLHIVSQWQNVLFDYLLQASTRVFGYGVGERVAVSVCVLVFFWGAFALVSAFTSTRHANNGRADCGAAGWGVTPLLLMLTYGWVFNEGLLNFYLSAGLSFFVLAIIVRGGSAAGASGDYAIALMLLVVVSRAHVLGLVCAIAMAGFVLIATQLGPRWYPAMAMISVVGFFAIRQYVLQHYRLVPNESDVYWLAGADQLVLFGPRYKILAELLLPFCIVTGMLTVMGRWREWIEKASIPLMLFAILAIAEYWSPGGVVLPGMRGQLGLLPDRISIFTAALGCCVMGSISLRKWQTGALTVFALVFFFSLYGDTGRISAAETRVEELVRQLPPNQRVVGTLEVQGSRVPMRHIVDRACIGRCFSYANYEPASDQFRIRAEEYNSIVVSSEKLSYAMQYGYYPIQEEDLPAYQIYFCGEQPTDICMTPWSAGIINSFSQHPPPIWR